MNGADRRRKNRRHSDARAGVRRNVGAQVHALGVYFDPDNRCDLCNKPLLVTDPIRSRCDQCVRYGAPEAIELPIRSFGAKPGVVRSACAGCERVTLDDGVTPLALADGLCLGCRLAGTSTAG